MLSLNQQFKHEFSFTQEQVNLFGQISGDTNPLHYDVIYAANTAFKKPIVHGILSASVFSKYFGTINPGEGTIYLKQSLEFLRPMFVDVLYEALMRITEIIPSKNIAIVECIVKDKISGKNTIVGTANLMNKEKIK